MFRTFLTCTLFCVLTAPALPQTVTVIGVVVDSKTKLRRPNVKVGLYCDDARKCSLEVEEETRGTGVYALTQSNLGLSKIYIAYDGPTTYSADPKEVLVNCQDEKRPCILFADDMELMDPRLSNDPAKLAAHLNAVASTQAIKVKAGKTDLKSANEVVAEEIAKHAAFYSANNKKISDEKALDEIFSALKKTPKINGLPELEIVTKESKFKEIRHRQDFKDYKSIDLGPSFWKKKAGTIDPKAFDKILNTPNKDIPLDWLNDSKYLDYIRENIKTKAAASPDHTFILITGDKLGPVHFNADTKLSDAAIRDLFKDHPDIRAWAFYGTMDQNLKLNPQQQKMLHDRNRSNHPLMIPLKKK